MARESKFQLELISELEHMFPGCMILKNDSNYLPGIPDLLILWGEQWAVLECKRSADAPFRPNQEDYIDQLDKMSFSAAIYPENKEEILDALQRSFGTYRASCLSEC